MTVTHLGRNWDSHPREDACPCRPKAPCGLVASDHIDPTCVEHSATAPKTIRQHHDAADCPGPDTAPPTAEPEPDTTR